MAHLTPYCLLALALLALPGRSQDGHRVVYKQETQKPDKFLFEVRPRVITAGETAVLRWSIKAATKVTIEEAIEARGELRKVGTFGARGSLEIRPTESRVYVITCQSSSGYTCASVTVRVRVNKR